jgi:hypothetical protein
VQLIGAWRSPTLPFTQLNEVRSSHHPCNEVFASEAQSHIEGRISQQEHVLAIIPFLLNGYIDLDKRIRYILSRRMWNLVPCRPKTILLSPRTPSVTWSCYNSLPEACHLASNGDNWATLNFGFVASRISVNFGIFTIIFFSRKPERYQKKHYLGRR